MWCTCIGLKLFPSHSLKSVLRTYIVSNIVMATYQKSAVEIPLKLKYSLVWKTLCHEKQILIMLLGLAIMLISHHKCCTSPHCAKLSTSLIETKTDLEDPVPWNTKSNNFTWVVFLACTPKRKVPECFLLALLN